MTARDTVDRVLEGWARELPGLDTSPLRVTHRITAIATNANQVAETVFARLGATGALFDVLAGLYAAGRPYQLNPTTLSQGRVISSGGMTARLDLAERARWIRRSRDPNDRRGVTLTLTDQGIRLVRGGVNALLAEQSQLAETLSPSQRVTVDRLLAKVLVGESRSPAGAPAPSLESLTASWIRDFGDLDALLMRFLSAIALVSARIERESGKVVKPLGLTPNGFGLLCALRRAGEPYRLLPSDLYRLVILSPAGVSAQLDRMMRAGLVRRTVQPEDRRVQPVSLTKQGREIVEGTIGDFIASHRNLVRPLMATEQQRLARLLRRILLSMERARGLASASA